MRPHARLTGGLSAGLTPRRSALVCAKPYADPPETDEPRWRRRYTQNVQAPRNKTVPALRRYRTLLATRAFTLSRMHPSVCVSHVLKPGKVATLHV